MRSLENHGCEEPAGGAATGRVARGPQADQGGLGGARHLGPGWWKPRQDLVRLPLTQWGCGSFQNPPAFCWVRMTMPGQD